MEKYRIQLEQVKSALEKQPLDSTLLALKSKLEHILFLKSNFQPLLKPTLNVFSASDFEIGESCEIWDDSNSQWKLGQITSKVSECNMYIVQLNCDKSIHRLPSDNNIRRPFPKKLTVFKKSAQNSFKRSVGPREKKTTNKK